MCNIIMSKENAMEIAKGIYDEIESLSDNDILS